MNWEELKIDMKKIEETRKAFSLSNPEEYRIICLLETFAAYLRPMSPHGPLGGINRSPETIVNEASAWVYRKRQEYPDLPESIVVSDFLFDNIKSPGDTPYWVEFWNNGKDSGGGLWARNISVALKLALEYYVSEPCLIKSIRELDENK